MRQVILLLAGLALLVAALYVAHRKLATIQLGAHTSRLVGVLCALVAYFYFRHSWSLSFPKGEWGVSTLLTLLRSWGPPVLLFGAAGWYTITTFKNWRSEFLKLLHSAAWLTAIIGLAIAARYVLAL